MDLKGNHKCIIKIKKLKELFRINKVITLLKFKSAVNLQCFLLEAQSRERDRMNFAIEFALSIAPPIRNTAIPADLNSKSVITYNFVNSEQLFQFFDFYYTFVVSFKVHFLF